MSDKELRKLYVTRCMILVQVVTLLLVLVVSSTCSYKPSRTLEATVMPYKALPIRTSDWENSEPLSTATSSTVPLSLVFTRRVYADPLQPDNWHELIVGASQDKERVYAYFHFLPLKVVQDAERDIKTFRWGLLMGKYLLLTHPNLQTVRGDPTLARECKEAAPFFYDSLHSKRREGVEIRGIHLSVTPFGKLAVITATTTETWDDIHKDLVNGNKNQLYGFFPVAAQVH